LRDNHLYYCRALALWGRLKLGYCEFCGLIWRD
jgi:hypothetical protein